MPKITRPYSRMSRQALALLSRHLKLARKERGMSEQELAERAGMSRGLIRRIEGGDPGCQIGAVFEVAAIVGVRLFDSDAAALEAKIKDTESRLALLPKHTHPDSPAVNDEF